MDYFPDYDLDLDVDPERDYYAEELKEKAAALTAGELSLGEFNEWHTAALAEQARQNEPVDPAKLRKWTLDYFKEFMAAANFVPVIRVGEGEP